MRRKRDRVRRREGGEEVLNTSSFSAHSRKKRRRPESSCQRSSRVLSIFFGGRNRHGRRDEGGRVRGIDRSEVGSEGDNNSAISPINGIGRSSIPSSSPSPIPHPSGHPLSRVRHGRRDLLLRLRRAKSGVHSPHKIPRFRFRDQIAENDFQFKRIKEEEEMSGPEGSFLKASFFGNGRIFLIGKHFLKRQTACRLTILRPIFTSQPELAN